MDIIAEKSFLIKKLEEINDVALLKEIHALIERSQFQDQSYLGESVEVYNREIEEAKSRILSGKFTSHEDVKKAFA
ncbi:MAG: hypothetical protein HYZ44_01245 [Bacteroidetes bacterium]|nr:hypothetical protein [Bacteroidota bacterium]